METSWLLVDFIDTIQLCLHNLNCTIHQHKPGYVLTNEKVLVSDQNNGTTFHNTELHLSFQINKRSKRLFTFHTFTSFIEGVKADYTMRFDEIIVVMIID